MKRSITNTLDTPQEVLALGVTLAPGESLEVEAPADKRAPAAVEAKKTKQPAADATKGDK